MREPYRDRVCVVGCKPRVLHFSNEIGLHNFDEQHARLRTGKTVVNDFPASWRTLIPITLNE